MSTPTLVFKFSRAGKVFRENVTLAEAVILIHENVILQTDHYWSEGMTEWKLVSARSWSSPSESVRPPAPVAVPTPVPVVTTPPVQPKPAPVVAPVAAKPLVIEKGYSPYAAYYRSKDSRWGYGIFGGLAHRNGWSGSTLFQVRFFTLLFILPALAYVGTWGLFVMLMTPALPTNKVKSYFDVGG
jgi:phage shock protein PspC (stress-responsive transcriptional regulator)